MRFDKRISNLLMAAGILACLAHPGTSQADDSGLLTYHFDAAVWVIEIYDGTPPKPEFVIGDIYHVQITIDGLRTDVLPELDNSGFDRGLYDFKIVADPGNIGTWNPPPTGPWQMGNWIRSFPTQGYGVTGAFAENFPPVTIHGVQNSSPAAELWVVAPMNDTGPGETWIEQVGALTGAGLVLYFNGDPTNSGVHFVASNIGEGPHPDLLPPVAVASGPDHSVECTSPAGAVVTLDGSGSYDPGGDSLDYEWSVADGSGVVLDDPTSPVTTGTFPVGVHEVTLTVYDVDAFGVRKGGVGVDSVTVVVVDDIPPVALVTTDLASLWPADNKMTAVTVHVVASDACTAPNDLSILCTVSSDQPDASRGATNLTGDVNGSNGYSAPIPIHLQRSGDGTYSAVIKLRAERDPGVGSGRTYSINLDVIDDVGNLGHASTTVVVPQNQKKK